MLVVSDTIAQDEANIFGTVATSEDRSVVISDVTIEVKKDGESFKLFSSDMVGQFDFNLELDFKYEIYFSKKEYVTKWVIIDTKNIPEEDKEGGFAAKIDMSLFKKRKNLDASILERPIGIMHYFFEENNLNWVMSHTEKIRGLVKESQLLADSLNKPEFDKLMGKGDMAAKKGNKKKAKKFYQKAKALIPSSVLIDEKLKALKTKPRRVGGVWA